MRDPDKPQQIIEAAIRVFARNGYYNSRVSDIARDLGLSVKTVSTYRARVLEKLGMRTSAEMMRYAIENDLLDS